MNKKLNYYNRDYASIRQGLINILKKYYPDTYTNFNDASIGSALLELVAAVGDMLSYNTDKVANEVLLDYAQEEKQILAIARSNGFRINPKTAALTVCEISVTVPVLGESFDLSYAPIITRSSQVTGGGQTFELVNDVDFSSPFSQNLIPNRKITPNIDGNGTIVNYTLTKSELVIAGKSKFFKRVITSSDAVKFLEITLPDSDVLSVESITALDGTSFTRNPTIAEQTDEDNIWYYVDNLCQNKVFVEQPLLQSDRDGVRVGKWVDVSRRFTYEFTNNGFAVVRFGNGNLGQLDSDNYSSDLSSFINKINDFNSNAAFGEIPKVGSTMFIKYRVGGGLRSNIGIGVLTSLGQATVVVLGSNPTINQRVRNSITVTNPIPAVGGRDGIDVEEVRNLVKYNTNSYGRGVSLKDYYALVSQMPAEFGAPYRYNVSKIDNKVSIQIVSLDANGYLTNQSTNTIKENIAEYLSTKCNLLDYIVVSDAKIINIAYEIDIFVDKNFNLNETANSVIDIIYNFHRELNLSMGQDIYLSQLINNVTSLSSVINVQDLRVFNRVGGNLYSLNNSSQELVDSDTMQLNTSSDNVVYAEYDEIIELKYKNKDIKVRFVN